MTSTIFGGCPQEKRLVLTTEDLSQALREVWNSTYSKNWNWISCISLAVFNTWELFVVQFFYFNVVFGQLMQLLD